MTELYYDEKTNTVLEFVLPGTHMFSLMRVIKTTYRRYNIGELVYYKKDELILKKKYDFDQQLKKL